jgi:lysophospholipase L1-like esterase
MAIKNFVLLSILAASSLGVAAESTFYPLWRDVDTSEQNTGLWFRPDVGAKDAVLPLKTRVWATKESVTDGVALKIVMEKGSKGSLSYEMEMPNFKGTAGVTFYAKASRPLKVKVGNATADVGTDWKKIDLTWDAVGKFDWKGFVISVVGPIEEKTTLLLDRVGSEGPEFIAAPKITPEKGPDVAINSKDMLYGAENLAKVLANAKAKKPFKIVTFGDSVAAGAQMSRGSPGVRGDDGVAFLFFSHLARLWEEHFGYKGITTVRHAKGGFTAKQGIALVDQGLADIAADDLVIIEYGANDMGYGKNPLTPAQWKDGIKVLIAKIKPKSDQILVLSPTAGGFICKNSADITKNLQDLVKEEKVAGGDVTKLSCYRGEAFSWALLANQYHPDYMGHISIAEMLAPILTDKHINYPE